MSQKPRYPLPNDRRPALQPPQFRTSTMLKIVAVICVGLTLWQSFFRIFAPQARAPATAAALLLGLAVLAHLAGGALGTKLRLHGDSPPEEPNEGMEPARRAESFQIPVHYAPATRLSHRTPLSWLLVIPILLGAAGATWIGLLLLTGGQWQLWPFGHLILAAVSFFVLGGLFGFGASSLLAVLLGAIMQAHRESLPVQRPGRVASRSLENNSVDKL